MQRLRSPLLAIGLVCAASLPLAACGGTGAMATPAGVMTTASPGAATSSAPTTTPSAAAISPASSPDATSTFASAAFAVPVSFSLAGGWTVSHEGSSNIDLLRDDHGAGPYGTQNAGIQDIATTTVAGATTSDPPMPWPTDLYAWLESRPEFEPHSPKAITLDGRPAIQIDADVTVPDGTRIDFVCSAGSNCWLLDHNDRWRFVEVKNGDGSGVVWITNGIPAPAFDAYGTALDELLGTFAFR
jgi:hypothetical protein